MTSLVSCSTYQATGIKGKSATYVVKAGNHEMEGGRVMILKEGKYDFTVTTDESWIWEVPEKNGFSKVTGVGWVQSTVQNTARLVYWINKKGNPEFWAYFYINDISPQMNPDYKKKLIDVEPGKSYTGWVGYSDGFFTVRIGGEQHSVKAKGHGIPYLMNPYIGGTYTIDHDWIVRIKYF